MMQYLERVFQKKKNKKTKKERKNILGKVCVSISTASIADLTNCRSFSIFISTSLCVKRNRKSKIETENQNAKKRVKELDTSGILRAKDGWCENHGQIVGIHVCFHLIFRFRQFLPKKKETVSKV
jgi:hypothetical protein